jgi:hypothetical protein
MGLANFYVDSKKSKERENILEKFRASKQVQLAEPEA